MKKLDGKFDFDDATVRSRVLSALGRRRGWQEIEAKDYHPLRTSRQNKYYWPCFCQLLADYMVEQGNSEWDRQMAHEMFRLLFLKTSSLTDDGRLVESVRSTTSLTTAEFNEYLDNIAQLLATEFQLIVPEPAEYREAEPASVE
jgi:hypothetical protein